MSLTSEEKQQKLDELNEFIAQHKDDKGALMPVMQKAQELFGYLSLEIQSVIAEALNVPGRSVRSSDFLRPVFPGAQGRICNRRMYGHRLLC